MKMKLPDFKVTQRATKGMGKGQGESSSCAEPALSPATSLPELCSIDEEPIPSLHAIKQHRSMESYSYWPVTNSDWIPCNALWAECCFVCSAIASYRCVQCGPNCYYCSQCLGYSHSMGNIFHIPEEWVVSHYIIVCNGVETTFHYIGWNVQTTCNQWSMIDVCPPHQCSTAKDVCLCCVDDKGIALLLSCKLNVQVICFGRCWAKSNILLFSVWANCCDSSTSPALASKSPFPSASIYFWLARLGRSTSPWMSSCSQWSLQCIVL